MYFDLLNVSYLDGGTFVVLCGQEQAERLKTHVDAATHCVSNRWSHISDTGEEWSLFEWPLFFIHVSCLFETGPVSDFVSMAQMDLKGFCHFLRKMTK